MNAGGQGGFQVNEGAANANIRGAMPRGGGNGGGIVGAIRDIADRKGRQADRERDNVDYAWRRGVDYEHSSNLSKLQSGLRITETKVGGKEARKTSAQESQQRMGEAAQGATLRSYALADETRAQDYLGGKTAKRESKARKQTANIAEKQAASTHKRNKKTGKSDTKNAMKLASMYEGGKPAQVAFGTASASGTLKKPAPTAAAAQKATTKKPRQKPPTA
jgi:hypothetical protein